VGQHLGGLPAHAQTCAGEGGGVGSRELDVQAAAAERADLSTCAQQVVWMLFCAAVDLLLLLLVCCVEAQGDRASSQLTCVGKTERRFVSVAELSTGAARTGARAANAKMSIAREEGGLLLDFTSTPYRQVRSSKPQPLAPKPLATNREGGLFGDCRVSGSPCFRLSALPRV
jgi:hypothetical protein